MVHLLRSGRSLISRSRRGTHIPRERKRAALSFESLERRELLSEFAGPAIEEIELVATATGVTGVRIIFDSPLDPATATAPANYSVAAAGKDKRFGTRDDKIIPAQITASDSGDATTLIVSLQKALKLGQFAALNVSGVTDTAALPLDGNNDGFPGGSYSTLFARGTSLNYADHNGDKVVVSVTSGILEIFRRPDGEATTIDVDAGDPNRSVLSGTVKRPRSGSSGDGMTALRTITGQENLFDVALSQQFVVDGEPPSVTVETQVPNGLTNRNVVIRGHVADPGVGVSMLRFRLDLGPVTMVPHDSNGNFMFATSLPLNGNLDGPHVLRLIADDLIGNLSTVAEVNFTLDTIAPAAPAGLDLTSSSDTGASSTDDLTRDATPTVELTAEPNTRVRLFIDGVLADEANANGLLNFTVPALGNGSHTITARAEDAAGNMSATSAGLTVIIDTLPPALSVTGPAANTTLGESSDLTGSASDAGGEFPTTDFRLDLGLPNTLGVDPATGAFSEPLDLASLSDGAHQLHVRATDAAGNLASVLVPFRIDFGVPVHINEFTPADGEQDVSLIREAEARFDDHVDPATVTSDAFYLVANGEPVPATIRVSPTEMFASIFPTDPLPPSTEVRIVVDGDKIMGRDGLAIDANGDGQPGGLRTADFATLSLVRIPGTNVRGRVVDSYNKDANGNDIPVVGATIRVDAFAEANTTTDSDGWFLLRDLPAPVVFVHIDGSTARNAPSGTVYPTVGKPFHPVPGQTIQLNMGGVPFDIHLPPMAMSDIQPLSATVPTDVGFGPAGQAELRVMFPDIDPAMLDRMTVTIPPGSAVDRAGNAATQATVIPVPPDRLPAPLPPNVDPMLVVSIQAIGATNFDVPAPVTFPNLEGLAPGTKTLIWSFNHAAGRWDVIGTGTVSDDGLSISSDPGVGIRAPGWHFTQPGTVARGGGAVNEDEVRRECDKKRNLAISKTIGATIDVGVSLIPAAKGAAGILQHIGLKKIVTDHIMVVNVILDPANGKYEVGEAAVGFSVGSALIALFHNLPWLGALPDVFFAGQAWADYLQHCSNSNPPFLPPLQPIVQGFPPFLPILPPPPTPPPILPDNIVLEQARLLSDFRDTYSQMLGSPVWTEVAELEVGKIDAFFSALAGTLDSEGPEGVRVSAAERGFLRQMPLPSNVAETVAETLIDRMDRVVAGEQVLTASESTALRDAAIELQAMVLELQSRGWKTTADAYFRGLPAAAVEADESLAGEAVIPSQSFFKVSNLDSGFVQRGILQRDGRFPDVILAPDTLYSVELLHLPSTDTAVTSFVTASSGSNFEIPKAALSPADSTDIDGDGLPDEVEDILGTSATLADTDHDGITDLAEIQQGMDPLGGFLLPTGIVASVVPRGEAKEVIIEGSALGAGTQLAYLSTGSYGLAVVDTSQFTKPVVLGQLDLPGDAVDVSVDSTLKIAAVATGVGGLQLVDVSDPMLPRLHRTVSDTVNQVEVADGVAYATVDTTLKAIDLSTGDELESLNVPGAGRVVAMAREGTRLYVFTKQPDSVTLNGTFSIVDISGEGSPQVRGQISVVAADRGRVFVGNGLAYISGGGLTTIDVTTPNSPRLISDADTRFNSTGLALNGSGLALITTEELGVSVFNVTDPQDTDAFLVSIDTPGFATEVAIAAGIAFVADGAAGLQVVNYREFDNKGNAPSVSLSISAVDVDPILAGIQLLEGTTVPLIATVNDDVQVRNVDFLLNGQVVANDVSFPFDFSTVTPNITLESNTVTIEARTTDTGGNSKLSDPIVIQIVPDTFGPTIVSVDPADGTTRSQATRKVRIAFSEPLAPASVTTESFRLLDGSGSPVVPADLQLRSDDRLVQLTFDALSIGSYELVIDAASVTDRAGNALGQSDVTSGFAIAPSVTVTATITADNHYGLYFGEADGTDLTIVGRNEKQAGGDPGAYDWSLPETFTFDVSANAYVYVVAWDYGSPQMWIGEFDLFGGEVVTSNLTDWEYMTGTGPNPGVSGDVPPVDELIQAIRGATWATPAASATQPSPQWGVIPGISSSAEFVWQDTFGSGSTSAGTYAIFRTKAPITALGG